MHTTGLPALIHAIGMLLIQVSAEQVTCTPAQPIGVSADEDLCCAGEWRQGLSPERLQKMKPELKHKIAKMMRQRGDTLKLIKCVDSLIKGDD